MISKKLQALKPSAVYALVSQAKEYKDQGRDVINASIGQPSWECFNSIKEKGITAIKEGASGYSPASGLASLRQQIAEDTNHHLGLDYTLENVTVSIGAKYICFASIQALVNPNEEVIIPAPYWVSYPSMVNLCEGIPIVVECDDVTQKLKPEVLEKHLNENTRLLILNSPNNPTGAVYSLKELREIGECLKKWRNIYIISDDIYNRIFLSGSPGGYAPHILQACPELKERVVVVNAVSKNYAMPGWRVGWAVCTPELAKAMTSFQSQTVSCAPTVAQKAMMSCFKECGDEIKKVHALLNKKRERICKKLNLIKGIKFQNPEGAFYLWINVKELYGRKYKEHTLNSSMDVCRYFIQDQAVFTVPGEEFGKEGYLRFNFSLSDEELDKSTQRLQNFILQLS